MDPLKPGSAALPVTAARKQARGFIGGMVAGTAVLAVMGVVMLKQKHEMNVQRREARDARLNLEQTPQATSWPDRVAGGR